MKYALITGASRGIGRAAGIKLANDGFFVLINYRSNKKEALETLRLIQQNGGKAELMPFDISNQEETETELDKWFEKNPEKYIEVLVNNAGIRKDNLHVFMQNSEWQDVINTNLNNLFIKKNVLTQ